MMKPDGMECCVLLMVAPPDLLANSGDIARSERSRIEQAAG